MVGARSALGTHVRRVALLPGSIRAASVHRRLARVLADRLADHGVESEVIDLADYAMPIYHGDEEVESGAPVAAVELHDRLATFDGLILVTPEYNGGPTALLKNAIDWVTRVDRAVFAPMLLGLAAASPGSRGGTTVLGVMRTILEHMRLRVADDQLSLPRAGEAFEEVEDRTVLVRPEDAAAAEAFVAGYVASLHDPTVPSAVG